MCGALPTLPHYHHQLWGALGLVPFAARELTVIGLPDVLAAHPGEDDPGASGATLHAVAAAGGQLATWHAVELRFVTLDAPAAGRLELVAGAEPGTFVAPRPWSGSGVAAIEVQLPTAARAVVLRLLDEPDPRLSLPAVPKPAPAGRVWFDTTVALGPPLLQSAGVPFRGVRLEVDGAPADAASRVVVHGKLPVAPLPRAQRGGRLDRRTLAAWLRDTAPAGANELVLLPPSGAKRAAWPIAAQVPAHELPPPLAEHLAFTTRVFAPVCVHWFWRGTGPDGAPWLSELDWAIVEHGTPDD